MNLALNVTSEKKLNDRNIPIGAPLQVGAKKVSSRALSYSEKARGQWFRPEYDLQEIQIAQDTDGYIYKSIQLKVNRFMLSGWEWVGLSKEVTDYIKERIREIEILSGTPFSLLLSQTAQDLVRFSNCMWVKVRNPEASSGKKRKLPTGRLLDPVAGYFILPFETLKFKQKANGEIKKIQQYMPDTGQSREFAPEDVIHFYTNKKPGFAMGTPELLPVVNDVALLRTIEEDVETLINTTLHPVFHWSVGNDNLPERIGPDGVKETDVVKKTIDYMPAGGIFVTDHRHNIDAIGGEGRALRIEGYLDYFKKRVFAGLGVSSVDMGEGDTANRATAQTLSKRAIQDVEALQLYMKLFIDNFVVNELLLESEFGIKALKEENKVEIKFGVVDKEEETKLENQTIQLFLNKLITEPEARKRLRLIPFADEERELNYFKLYEEPLAMTKALGTPIADQTLLESNTSSVSSQGMAKQEAANKQELQVKKSSANANPSSSGAKNQSASQSRPSNQYGTRSSPKFTKDLIDKNNGQVDLTVLDESFKDGVRYISDIPFEDKNVEEIEKLKIKCQNRVDALIDLSLKRIEELTTSKNSPRPETIIKALEWRFESILDGYAVEAYELGVDFAKEKLVNEWEA